MRVPGLFLFFGLLVQLAHAQSTSTPQPARYALLVGVTHYPNIAGIDLKGPANDVVLFRKLLTSRFAFTDKDIVTLAEAEGEPRWPTRANIQREFERLAEVVNPGDRVVILVGGHGSQQPEDPRRQDNYKADGMNEVFMPRDIKGWDGAQHRVTNAVVDYELRDWLKAIRAKGASLWVMIDSCHSATMVRGTETLRSVPAIALQIPKDAIQSARQRAEGREKTRGKAPEDVSRVPDLAALYAALPTEPTVERVLPPDNDDGKPYGLLTYTVCQVLAEAKRPITYRELGQRVRAQYDSWGRTSPTPVVEGKDQDYEVLGNKEWHGRSRIQLVKNENDELKVSAGSIHGVRPGSILAVSPPPGAAAAAKPLGHVRVKQVEPFEATVEPCAHAGLPALKELPSGGTCQVVYADYGSLRLKLGIDVPAEGGDPARAGATRLKRELQNLAKDSASLIDFADDPTKADWILRVVDERALLVPAAGWAVTEQQTVKDPLFGPITIDDQVMTRMRGNLIKIARVKNLLHVAGELEKEWESSEVKVEVQLLRYRDRADREGQVVEPGHSGVSLKTGDIWGFQVRNPNDFSVDVTLLYVDSRFQIQAYFPETGTKVDNRLPPRQEKWKKTPRMMVDETEGLDHMLVIALRAKGDPADFSGLAQAGVEAFRGEGARGPKSPLTSLFETSLLGQGTTRGASKLDADNYAMRKLTWRTINPEARNK